MASTRDYVSLGEVAKNADEVQEPNVPVRTPGEAYRNTSFTTFQQKIGKQFNIIPSSENVNQQIFNQSQFTDLINKQGMPGWTGQVEYKKPAVVLASNGKIYFAKKDNTNVDPIGAINSDESFWGEFINAGPMPNILANQTPGDEGARLVGTTFTPDHLRVKRIGQTLQQAFDADFNSVLPMQNLKILAHVSGELTSAAQSFNKFNIDSVVVTPYSKTSPAFSNQPIGYLTINFINPIPTPYIYIANIMKNQTNINGAGGSFINGKPIFGSISISVADVTSTSIKLSSIYLTNMKPPYNSSWPSNWATEDPSSRYRWLLQLSCFTFI